MMQILLNVKNNTDGSLDVFCEIPSSGFVLSASYDSVEEMESEVRSDIAEFENINPDTIEFIRLYKQ